MKIQGINLVEERDSVLIQQITRKEKQLGNWMHQGAEEQLEEIPVQSNMWVQANPLMLWWLKVGMKCQVFSKCWIQMMSEQIISHLSIKCNSHHVYVLHPVAGRRQTNRRAKNISEENLCQLQRGGKPVQAVTASRTDLQRSVSWLMLRQALGAIMSVSISQDAAAVLHCKAGTHSVLGDLTVLIHGQKGRERHMPVYCVLYMKIYTLSCKKED